MIQKVVAPSEILATPVLLPDLADCDGGGNADSVPARSPEVTVTLPLPTTIFSSPDGTILEVVNNNKGPDHRFLENHSLQPEGFLYKAGCFEFFQYPDELRYDRRILESILDVQRTGSLAAGECNWRVLMRDTVDPEENWQIAFDSFQIIDGEDYRDYHGTRMFTVD